MHPADRLLEWFPDVDFGVLGHGLATHGRDYVLIAQFGGVTEDAGTYELCFTHCVEVGYETRVGDDAWRDSWTDDFIDYARWQAVGEPSGYVWGTNWSLAYPGLTVEQDSKKAEEWARRVGYPMYEIALETDRFRLSLLFHDIRWRKLDDRTAPVSDVVIPLRPDAQDGGQASCPANEDTSTARSDGQRKAKSVEPTIPGEDASMPCQNRPVFRFRRQRVVEWVLASTIVGILAGVLAAIPFGSIEVFPITLPACIGACIWAALVYERRSRKEVCSNPYCRHVLDSEVDTCPGCGGSLAGVISDLDQSETATKRYWTRWREVRGIKTARKIRVPRSGPSVSESSHGKFATTDSDLMVVSRDRLPELRQLQLPSYSGYYLPNREGRWFSDQDVAELVHLPGLEIVGLENAEISDASLAILARLRSLRILDIDNTGVTDGGISELRAHPNLEILWAEECEISDKCVPALLSCERLSFVSLMDTLVSAHGLDRLEAKGIEVLA